MKNKHKIAFVISSLTSGGAERVVSVLCNSFAKDYEVTLITLAKSESFYKIDEDVEIVSCSNSTDQFNGLLKSIRSKYFLIKKLVGILRAREIEVLIGFMRTSNILAVIAAKYLRIPVIISERNHPVIIDRSQSKFWKFLSRLTYPISNKLVVQTETIKGYYQKFVKSEKLEVIPNPINPDFDNTIDTVRENIILSVGRLIPQKAHHHLINVFSKITPPDWSLYIIGEGTDRKKLEGLVEKYGMSKKIKLPGRSKKVEDSYKKSKIFALTSNYEGFPNVLLEAMYFGLACVSTDCPSGPGDLINNGVNGLLVPVNNEPELEKKLRLLIADQELRQRLSKNASKTSDQYSIVRIESFWRKLIEFELSAKVRNDS